MNEAQATARVEELIRLVTSGIDPKPRLDAVPRNREAQICLPNEGQKLTGEIYVSHGYHLKGLPKDRLSEAGLKIKENWENAGHTITIMHRFDAGEPSLTGHTDDGFLLALDTTKATELLLRIGSPCFYPDKPSPSATP